MEAFTQVLVSSLYFFFIRKLMTEWQTIRFFRYFWGIIAFIGKYISNKADR